MCTIDPLMCQHYEYLGANKITDCKGKCGMEACRTLQKLKESKMEAKTFETKDSGKREEFSSGMVRDTQEGKLRVDVALDGPLAAEVFADDVLADAFNRWYQFGGVDLGARVVHLIAQREGGLISFFERYAGLMTRGAQKYSARNWMKAAGDAEYERFMASGARHFLQYLRGDKDEDHAAAVWFNINGAEFVRGKLAAAHGYPA